MKKITIDEIQIEITRDCNMLPQCDHCFRGDSQQVNIEKKYIDFLLDQTELIGTLFFTGGEPFINISAMDYFLDQLYQRGIPLLELHIISNGLAFSDKIIDTIKRYSEMVKVCNDILTDNRDDSQIIIGISIDKYHHYSKIALANLEKYKSALNGYAQVVKTAKGNLPRKEGRGQILNNGFLCSNLEYNNQKRIEILDSTHKPMCPQYRCYKMVKPEQIVICCGVYLNAYGYLMPSGLGLHDYSVVDDPDNHICHVSEPIYEKILQYNRGRLDCCTSLKRYIREIKANPLEPKRLYDTLFYLMHLREDDSDAINRNIGIGPTNIDNVFCRGVLNEASINQIMTNAAKHNYLIKDGAV